MMPLVLEYFSFGTIGVLCLWDAYRSKVLSRALATFEILRIVLWIPHDDLFAAILTFLQLSSAISTIYVYFSGYEYATLVTYVLWLLAWMCLIYYIGRILDDIGTLKRKPRQRTSPKKMKNGKKRKPHFPFHNRNKIKSQYYARRRRRIAAARAGDALSNWNTGWLDDGDPNQGHRNPRYWSVLHTSVLAQVWDDICKVNPDLVDITLGGDEMFMSRYFPSKSCRRVIELGFSTSNRILDLTQVTNTSDCFRFQSVFHVQSADNGAPIIFDSGASITITPYKEDFIGQLKTDEASIGKKKLLGISASSAVKGVGRIRLIVYTDTGAKRELVTEALYVPDARVRLLSVCRYREDNAGQRCSFNLDDRGCVFTFPKSIGGGRITFDYRGSNYIPKTTAYAQQFGKSMKSSSNAAFMVLDNSNVNLTAAQKELLKWHFCLGHFNLTWIQSLISKKIIPVEEKHVTSKNALCKCMACQLAKQTRRPEGTVNHQIRKNKDGNLKKNILRPGSMVSSDQFVSSLPGRLPNTYGKEAESEKYVGGTIFIDEASEYFWVHNQVSLNAKETLIGKHNFERNAIRNGVTILGYRADNGIYKADEFRDDLKKFGQSIQFCGVGAHHHNGVAERGIRTVSTSARAIMIHALIHWPEHVSMDLWPFAIKYAVYLWNRMPRKQSGLSPLEVFFDTKSDHQELRAAKVWGCPAYVLDPRIQDGKKIPRWSPRSKMGQFLGRSEEHAGSVGLIRNLKTNAVTAQFHVVYDNHFSTVSADLTADNVPVPPEFHDLYRFSRENLYERDDLLERRRTTLLNIDRGGAQSKTPTRIEPTPSLPPKSSPLSEPEGAQLPNFTQENTPTTPSGGNKRVKRVLFDSSDADSDDSSGSSPSPISDFSRGKTRSGRSFRDSHGKTRSGKSFRASYAMDMTYMGYIIGLSERLDSNDAFLIESDLNSKSDSMTKQFEAYSIYQRLDSDPELLTGLHPFAFAARANAEDTPRFHEAMRSPDREGFIEAMKKEMEQLAGLDAFVAVPRQKAIDEGRQIIDSTWAFKRKRFPDGAVKKLKARLCVRGDLQETDDAFDTYSPVVQWSTVRLLLILSIILKLETKQVDFTLAFVQAKADPGTYIEMPRMFEKEGYILELNRNLYGQRDAPIKFYEHLRHGLEERGFTSSQFDPCLFKSTTVMILTYVDDCIFFSRTEEDIDSIIDLLKSGRLPDGSDGTIYLLEVEGDYAGFLGIDISKSTSVDGALELLQTGLIDRILAALSLDDETTNIRTEPADKKSLGKDEDGPARKEHWSYASVIGMLLYLASNSRPDIAFAVNQCARFNHCAKLCHEKAVKRIGRYLKATRDNGLILKPNDDLNLELYADSDFAGLWNIENPNDAISVRSRTGYIITLSGLPVSWSSKLQTEIATSTMMAEYIALSTGMRELLPTINVFNEICDALSIERTDEAKVVRAFEDNEGALNLATKEMPKVTPSSKHFAVKYHWFRSKLNDPDYNIKVLPIDTSVQKADLFTKGLGRVEFQNKRCLLMGW